MTMARYYDTAPLPFFFINRYAYRCGRRNDHGIEYSFWDPHFCDNSKYFQSVRIVDNLPLTASEVNGRLERMVQEPLDDFSASIIGPVIKLIDRER